MVTKVLMPGPGHDYYDIPPPPYPGMGFGFQQFPFLPPLTTMAMQMQPPHLMPPLFWPMPLNMTSACNPFFNPLMAFQQQYQFPFQNSLFNPTLPMSMSMSVAWMNNNVMGWPGFLNNTGNMIPSMTPSLLISENNDDGLIRKEKSDSEEEPVENGENVKGQKVKSEKKKTTRKSSNEGLKDITNVDSRAKPKPKPYKCGVCNRGFSFKHVLECHERIHSGVRPYECTYCQKRFIRSHHLKAHVRIHTGERPYLCSKCDHGFMQPASLQRHFSRFHKEDKKRTCYGCKLIFSDKTKLQKHKCSRSTEFDMNAHLDRLRELAVKKQQEQKSLDHSPTSTTNCVIEPGTIISTRERKSKNIRHIVRLAEDSTDSGQLELSKEHNHQDLNSNVVNMLDGRSCLLSSPNQEN